MTGEKKKVEWSKVAFVATITLVIFLSGGVFATLRWQPYQFFEDGAKAAIELARQSVRERHNLVEEIKYDGEGVVSYDRKRAHEGLTLIQGLFREGVEIRLLNMDGDIVNRWNVDFFGIWPEPKQVPAEFVPATDLNYHTQGMWLLADGSIVFSVSHYGTVKMDRCGEIVWTVDRPTHHSVTPAPDGSFWVPGNNGVDDIDTQLKLSGVIDRPRESLVRYEDRLFRISADGVVLEDISVLRAFFSGEFEHELFDAWDIKWSEPTHINDIEIVTQALADRIPGVDAGDLLVSVRQMHMLIIVDRETGKINWHRSGPWVRQHDPDITGEGFIEVFDNGGEHREPERFLGSRIVGLDPATGISWTIYPAEDDAKFYTRIMGTHQLLTNGNRLITESLAGRVFEVTDTGEVVWDYVVPYDETHASLIESAIRYDVDYLSVDDGRCPAEQDTIADRTD